MPKPKERHVPRPTGAPRPGEVARAEQDLRPRAESAPCPSSIESLRGCVFEEFLRSYLPRADRRCRIAPRSASSSCSRMSALPRTTLRRWRMGRPVRS